MSSHWLKAKVLSSFLRESLENGYYRLTYREIAIGISGGRSLTKAQVAEYTDEIRHCWHRAERRLRKRGICAILVTKFYFDTFNRIEPTHPNEIMMCIAGGYDRAAHGVRLLSRKGRRNDPMALVYFRLRSRNLHGIEAAILDRLTIEHMRGKLTKARARGIADEVTEPALPDHDSEFRDLMGGD
jgi:hypothetical protein